MVKLKIKVMKRINKKCKTVIKRKISSTIVTCLIQFYHRISEYWPVNQLAMILMLVIVVNSDLINTSL